MNEDVRVDASKRHEFVLNPNEALRNLCIICARDKYLPIHGYPREIHENDCIHVTTHGNAACNCRLSRSEELEDTVNHPRHYLQHPSGVECITITEHMNFNIGNAVKYLWRADHKNGLEDLKKAAWYVNREIERQERG